MRGHDGALPPGGGAWSDSVRALRDYDFYRKAFARHGPVFRMRQYHQHVVCILGVPRIRSVLERHRDALRAAPLAIDRHTTAGLLRYMSPERHRAYRAQFRSVLTPAVVDANQGFIAAQAARVFDAMARDSRARGAAALAPHTDELAYRVCARVFLGVSPDGAAAQRLSVIYRELHPRRPWHSARAGAALAELVATVRGLARADCPPDSFLGTALAKHPEALDDPVFVENLSYFLHVARGDLRGLLGWLLKMLADHPEPGLRIRDEPGAADRFTSETLRLRQSEYLYRRAIAPLGVDGFEIPAGWLVRFCLRESHTDPAVFPEPLAFDPGRFARPVPADAYQPFGMDEHLCLGVPLTTTLSRVALETFVGRYDWALAADGPMELGWFHHDHWRPSRRFRLRLAPRSA